ncbi:PTS ascorbate transporter subunit IIC [Streptomyces echinoruber]|uniref:Ascorbate-specific PTS system EIIC component n=1 Tax=Streptomyces echinoruber TaxID=68898 RepID=A0A918VCI9_9ACTN|nr:PTS ascorbate transporter subunit IIC [Streptomyces echinoruber]GGZ88236.1 PTS ascorbate transporter subunit IIC [Streptomyces echinoruber]
MNWLVHLAKFLVNEVLSQPAYLIGIITAVGLAALRKPAGQTAGGAIKATLGLLLVGAGATLVTTALDPLGKMIQGTTGAHGVIPTNEAIAGIAQDRFGARVAWLMITGFLVSLLLARFTPLRYVFLTGHHMLFMATMLTVVMASAGQSSLAVVLGGGVLLGILLVAMPAFAHPWTKRVTGEDTVAMGHFGTAGYILAGATGQLTGKLGGRSRSTEDMRLPEGLRFLRDSMVATALSMVVVYLVMSLLFLAKAGRDTAFEAFTAATGHAATGVGDYLMQSLMEGLRFGIAVAVILFGVRTILGELVPAFQGIARRVVPGAKPALDAPIVFPYAQNAVLVGFVFSFLGGLTGLAVLVWVLNPAFGLALVLPGLVPHFFTGGAAGVYGNATGGRRGAMAGSFLNGLLITFLPALLLKVLGTFGNANTTFGDADFGWFGTLLGNVAKLHGAAGLAGMLALGAVVLAAAWTVQVRVVDAGWLPGSAAPAAAPPAGSGSGSNSGSGSEPVTAPVGSAPVGSVPVGSVPAQRTHARIAPPAGAPVPPPPPTTAGA